MEFVESQFNLDQSDCIDLAQSGTGGLKKEIFGLSRVFVVVCKTFLCSYFPISTQSFF